MAFVGGVILLVIIAMVLPHFGSKTIIQMLVGMVLVGLAVAFLWWLAIPAIGIWVLFFALRGAFKSSKGEPQRRGRTNDPVIDAVRQDESGTSA